MTTMQYNEALDGVVRHCHKCGKPFISYVTRSVQTQCARCADLRQRRPSTVVEREELLWLTGVKVVSLPPASWQEFKARSGDDVRFKLEFSGSSYGASWAGRIVMWAKRPIVTGDVVTLRHMRAKHVKISHVENDQGQTERKETIEQHEYIALDTTPLATPTSELVFVTAVTKTTIKGFGRQYWADIDGVPLWFKEIHGQVRSGRAGTAAWLAVVDDEHPVIAQSHGDIEHAQYLPSNKLEKLIEYVGE